MAGILLAMAAGTAPAQTSPPQAAPARTEAGSADESRPRQQRLRLRVRQHELIYGAQIMTPQEREAYRARLRAAKTEAERRLLRTEHRERMAVRAREQGVNLPEDVPAHRSGPASQTGGIPAGSRP